MLLLISGNPGAGKTCFCKWLRAKRGYVHVEMDEPNQLGNLAVQDETQARRARDTAASLGHDVAVEWGYPPDLLPSVRLLKAAGFEPWWFDADEPIARTRWQEARHGADLAQYRAQVAGIANAWPSLAKFYGDRVIHTVQGSCVMSNPDIASRILG